MNTLRRIIASLALAAFVLPTSRMAGSHCASATSQEVDAVASDVHASMSAPATAECTSCGAPDSEQVPPCDHAAAGCASMASCVSIAAAEQTGPAGGVRSLHATVTRITAQRPLGPARAPEPPPPRA